jgi:PST family polysaccharide transporter
MKKRLKRLTLLALSDPKESMNINWQRFLPQQIVEKLERKENIVKILANTFWLVSDRVIRMFVALFVGAWVARYLSPDNYGKLNNALAFSTMFGSFALLGFESILIRDLVRDQNKKNVLLGTAFYLRMIAGIIAYLLAVTSVLIIRNGTDDLIVRQLVYIVSFGILFQSFDVIDFYFQSQIKSKYTVFAKNISFAIVSGIKIGMLVFKVSLIWFAWISFAEVIFNAGGLYWIYKRKGNQLSEWYFDINVAKTFFKESWTMYIAFISAFVYMKIDQIMISELMDDTAAGIFAASTKLYEIPLFILLSIASSVFPSLVNIYHSDRELFFKRYEQITFLTTLIGYAVLIGTWLFGDFFITLFFGTAFKASYDVLKIQMIAMFFLFNGCLRSSYLTITSNQKIIMYTSIISAAINIILNYILIKTMGVKGAALSIALTYFFAVFFLNIFFDKTKRLFTIQLKSIILLPLRNYRKKFKFKE